MPDSLRPHESQHSRPPCPSQTPRVYSNSCPSSRWCHSAISSSAVPFSSAPNPSQHQGLFQQVNSSHEVAKVLAFQLQHQSFHILANKICSTLKVNRLVAEYYHYKKIKVNYYMLWYIINSFILFKQLILFFFFIVMDFVIHWNETAMGLHVLPIPIPPPTSLSTRSLWVFPVHQVRVLISCIQPGLVICFTLDNIHVPMLFSWNIPPSPSSTESKRLFYISVSLFLFCI